jgi:hypothetical protein
VLARGQLEVALEQGVAFLEEVEDGILFGGLGHGGSPSRESVFKAIL